MDERIRQARQEKAAQRKKQICATAVRLFHEKGYEAVTVSEICRAVGIAKGSFYLHYQSKEDIIRDSYDRDVTAFVTDQYTVYLANRPRSTAVERICALLCLELDFARQAGRERTCRAYALQLGYAIQHANVTPQKGNDLLRQEIEKALPKAHPDWTADTVYAYAESLVRGIIATWCCGDDAALDAGKEYIRLSMQAVYYGAKSPRRDSLATELL